MKNEKPRGSFGLPDDLLKAINDVERKKRSVQEPEPTNDVEEIVEQEAEKPVKSVKITGGDVNAELTEEEKKAKIEEVINEIKKDLGVEITEDDVWSMLFNNEIIKRGITVIPGKMSATFRTISLDDTNEVDSKMASELKIDRLENGYKNINTQYILSQGLIELGKPGQLKPLGETAEERFKAIGKMSALVVEKLGRKWNEFVFLVDETLKEEMESKKE